MMSKEEIRVYIWMNGKKADSTCVIIINESINSLRRLKNLISENMKSNRNMSERLDRMIIYNYKGMEIDDSDIPYLTDEQVLYVSPDGSSFSIYNYVYEYIYVSAIKSGGFGKVYLAKHSIKQDQYVAIKKNDVSNLNTDEIYNISREAMYMESFNHKNIIKLINTYVYEESFYCVMQYAQGGELSSYLESKGGVLSEMEAKRIFKQIHEAVKYIHGRNVIHRDLKPNNILFIDKNHEHIVLIDFGISGYNSGNVKEQHKAGTTKFIPPEVAAGLNYSSSPKIDIWALGVILFHMLFGKFPFDAKTDHDIMIKIVKEAHKFPSNIIISKLGYNLINALLEKNPQLRIEMNNPLFEEWYEDICSDQPIISKHKSQMSTINTDSDDVVYRSSHSNGNSISPKKKVHHRIKSISITAIDTNNNGYGENANAPISPLKTIGNKGSPRSNSIARFSINTGKHSSINSNSNNNSNSLSNSVTIRKSNKLNYLLNSNSITNIPNFENIHYYNYNGSISNSTMTPVKKLKVNSSFGLNKLINTSNTNNNSNNRYAYNTKEKVILPPLRMNK